MKLRKSVVLFVTIFLLSTVFVIAVHTVTFANSADPESVNEDVGHIYNITLNNSDTGQNANITQVNITIPSSFSFIADSNDTDAGANAFTNTSTVLSWSNVFLINGSEIVQFWFNATAATPGTYNITVESLNSTTLSATNLSVTINDTTTPGVTINFPVDGTNYSASDLPLNFNVTLGEAGIVQYSLDDGVNNVTMFNSSALEFNATNGSIADGTYIFSAYANDTAGNNNFTTKVNFTIDTTQPTATHSCSPSSATVGSTVTCSCSGSDATSGVQTTSYTANPSTTQTGTFTVTCTVTDYASNSATANAQYSVTQSASGGSGGSSITSSGATFTVDDEAFLTGYTKQLKKNERLKISVDGETHYVKVDDVSTSTATVTITSHPQNAVIGLGETVKFEVTHDDFYDLEVSLESITNGKAEITVKSLHEQIEESLPTKEPPVEQPPEEELQQSPEDASSSYVAWIIGILIIIALVVVLIIKNKSKGKKGG